MTQLRRRVLVLMFAGALGAFGSLEAGAWDSPRNSHRTGTHDTAKPCKKKQKKAKKRCKKRKGDGGGGGANCHASYPDFCIAPPPPDKDCADIGKKGFRVVGSDPHGFDGDGDGVGCET